MSLRFPRVSLFSFHCCFVAGLAAPLAAAAQLSAEVRVLDAGKHHLGVAGEPEWQEYADLQPEGRSLQITFPAKANSEPATLFIAQRDVKLRWPILLNGRRIAWLELNESPLVAAYPIPAGALKDGDNNLSILSPETSDDIFIEGIKLDPRSPASALRAATVHVVTTDKAGGAEIPCRLTIVDAAGNLAALLPDDPQSVAARTGVVYTGNGRASFGLPTGEYTVYATRGFEWGVDERKITVAAGQDVQVALQIAREVPTPGLVACDTHIHTLALSGHGDATVEERVLTLAGEGIELAVAAEHNRFSDYTEVARKMKVFDRFTNAVGNEVTTPTGHFITFPAASISAEVPNSKLTDWPALMESMRAVPGGQVVVLNHPRDIHNGFIPFDRANFNEVTGDNRRGPEFTFDAIEVANSGTLQSDFVRSYRDWFALLNHGYRITAIGSSDSHDVSRFIVGQGRTYISADDANPRAIDIPEACRSLKAGRASVSLGLLPQITVEQKFQPGDLAAVPGKEITVSVKVYGPSWTKCDRVELFANGLKIREQAIAPGNGGGEKASLEWKIPKPAHDFHLVAIASGPGVSAPYWAIPSPYQPVGGIRKPQVFGSTNPIWIDADGDGKFTAPKKQAEALIQRVGRSPQTLLPALADYDEATAAQAAGLCQNAGNNILSSEFQKLLRTTAESVRKGFAAYAATIEPR